MSHSLIFFGTPEIAAPFLEKFTTAGFDIPLVVTQPDRPVGRHRKLQAPPVKLAAEALGLPVRQVETLRQPEIAQEIQSLRPDLFVVVAFGLILPAHILNIPKLGAINMHASLLPKYRGASPIQAVLLTGETVTGWTVMLMDEGLDTGPILAQQSFPIEPAETTPSLTEKFIATGPTFCVQTLQQYTDGKIKPKPQAAASTPVTKRIPKEAGRIDWQQPAQQIERQIRAYQPWPGSFTYWGDLKIDLIAAAVDLTSQSTEPPGTVVVDNKAVAVVTGTGTLILQTIQPAGKKPMSAADFLRGRPQFLGQRLR